MDLISKLVGGQGCSADGAAAARNPLARLVDAALETAQPGGPPTGPPPPPGALAGGPRGRPGGMHAELQAGFHEGLHANVGPRGPPLPPPPPPTSSLARGLPRPMGAGGADPWAAEFMQHEMHVPPQARPFYSPELEEAYMERERMLRMQQQRNRTGPLPPPPRGPMLHARGPPPPHMRMQAPPPHLVAGPEAHEWGEEFERHVAGKEFPMHPAELEAEWEAAPQHMHARIMPHARPMMPPPPHAVMHHHRHPQHVHHEEPWVDELEAQQQPEAAAAELEGAWGEAGTHRDAILAGQYKEGGMEAAWVEAGTAVGDDRAATRAASAAVLEALRESSAGRKEGSKMARSEFVGFISRLSKGELELEGNTVVPGQAPAGAQNLDAAWEEADGGLKGRMHEVPQGVGLEGDWEATRVGVGPEVAAELDAAWARATTGEGEARIGEPGVAGDGVAQSVQDTLDEAWAEAEAEGGNIDLEGLWRAQAEEGKELDMDAFWDHVQAAASEYDKTQGKGISKAEAAELEASWQQQARDLEAWANATTEPGAYDFAQENEYLQSGAVSDLFAEGMALYQSGELRRAALAFEAEVQQRPENAEAWRMLGMTHAENDEDKRAIACLERAVEQDPYSLPALLALGVSYVNELDSVRALQNLKAWVEHNPKYQGLEIRTDEYSDGSLMDEVTQLMLQAHDWDVAASGGREDPDVQVVLGVLYNVSHDYDAAAAAFRKALDQRPDDYSLWNKLGATLANSQRSEEALPAYQRALELKPKYARGWLNMGISHANLSRYHEAARCYLQALRLNPEAGHIWGYLRVTFTAMERFDLVQLAAQQDPALFEGEFRTTLA